MKRSLLIACCVLACVATGAGASSIDGESIGVVSAEMVIAPSQSDFAAEAAQRRSLYRELVAGAAKHFATDLGALSPAEAEQLSGVNQPQSRRLLVGIDRPVDAEIDLALGDRMQVMGGVYTKTDGTMVWTATLRSQGATAVRAHLTEIALPKGAALYVYGTRGQAFGPYTGAGAVGAGELWTNSVLGDALTLQLEITGPVSFETLLDTYFVIDSVGHMGDRFSVTRWEADHAVKSFCTDGDGPINEPCVYNAACSSVPSAIAPAAQAIGEMLYASGSSYYICSGGLVADTAGTMTPYFLTANHCISTSTEAASLETYWDFTAPCGTTACDYAWDSGRAAPGATIVSTNSSSDYTLLQLASVPSGRTYLGWTSAAIAYSNGAGLYRLSHPSGAPQAYSEHSVSTTAGTCSSWPRGSWIYSKDTYGATEGGSSGSPVLNASGEIVGQLSGGCGTNVNEVCDTVNNATVDGAFSAYFSSVAPWLNPGSCVPSTEVCDGVDNDCDGLIDEDDVCGSPSCGERGDPCTTGADCCSNRCHPRKGYCR